MLNSQSEELLIHPTEPSEQSEENTSSGASRFRRFFRCGDCRFLCVLVALNLLNYVDRFTIAGVMVHIKEEMQLTDKQEGLLQTAFVLSFLLMAPVFGYLGDRFNRKCIIISGMAVWIGAVNGSSFCKSYVPFLLLRSLVGVGEAAYSTVAPTIITDLFTGHARTRALVAFYIALPVGSGLGFVVGSSVAEWTGHWAWGLRVSPLIGMKLLLVLAFCFKEPVRGQAEHVHVAATSYLEDVCALSRIPTYTQLNFACIVVYFVTGAVSWWTLNVTKYAWQVIQLREGIPQPASPEWFSTIVGSIIMFGGVLGVPFGSAVSTRWARGFTFGRWRVAPTTTSEPLYCAWALLVAAPAMWIALSSMLHFSLIVSWICMFISVLLLTSNYSLTTDMTMSVTLPNRRSTANAIQIAVAHLFGDAGSPYIVGLISDRLKSSYGPPGTAEHFLLDFYSLRDALLLSILVLPVGALFYFMSAITLERDRAALNDLAAMNGGDPGRDRGAEGAESD